MFVGNLPAEASEQSVRELFAEFGTVRSVEVAADIFTRKCRGFGFVELADKEAGLKAIEDLNGTELDGRPLTINEARPRTERR